MENAGPFTHLRAFRVLKESRKFCGVAPMEKSSDSNKRGRSSMENSQSSNVRTNIDLNETDDDDDDEDQEENSPERPTGRDKAKRQAKGKEKEVIGDVSTMRDSLVTISSEFTNFNNKYEKKVQVEIDKNYEKTKMKELKLFFADTSHLSERQKIAAEKVKEEIGWKYGL